eukprot:gene10460-21821_t
MYDDLLPEFCQNYMNQLSWNFEGTYIMRRLLLQLGSFFALVGCLICFIPFMMLRRAHKYQDIKNVQLFQTISNVEFQNSIIFSMAAVVPLLLDILLDSFVQSSDRNSSRTILWALLLSFVLPNVFIYFYIIPHEGVEILIPIISCVNICSTICRMLILRICDRNAVCKNGYLFFVPICEIIAEISCCFTPYTSSNYTVILAVIKIISQTISVGVFLHLCVHWIINIVDTRFHQRTAHECIIGIMILCLAGVALGIDYEAGYVSPVPGSNPGEACFLIHELRGACDSAADIMNDILVYEKIETGYVEMNLSQIQIKSFLKNKIESLALQARSKSVEIKLKFRELSSSEGGRCFNRACIDGDETKLAQVIRKILSCATEASAVNGVVLVDVELVLSQYDYNKNRLKFKRTKKLLSKYLVRIHIQDTGPGMT